MKELALHKSVFAFLILLLCCGASAAQEAEIERLESGLESLYGLDKLHALNRLTGYYLYADTRKDLRYGRRAVQLGSDLFNNPASTTSGLPAYLMAHYQLGLVLYKRDRLSEARSNFRMADSLASVLDYAAGLPDARPFLRRIDSLAGAGEVKENFFNRTFGAIDLGEKISDISETNAIRGAIRKAENFEADSSWDEAVAAYTEAINMLSNQGDREQIADLQVRVVRCLENAGQHAEASRMLSGMIDSRAKEQGPVSGYGALLDSTLGDQRPLSSEDRRKLIKEGEDLKRLAEDYEKALDYEKSLGYLKRYTALMQRVREDSIRGIAERARREDEIILLRQQKEIADLNTEAAESARLRQVQFRNYLLAGSSSVLLATLVILWLYFGKRKQHSRLGIAYRELEKARDKLRKAEQRIVGLLSQQLSGDIARELLESSAELPTERRSVCIMFLDIRDFTKMAEGLSPEQLIDYQNKVFGFMIDAVQKQHGVINQFLGDGFMATFGAPTSRGNDCDNAFNAAMEILTEVKERSRAGLIRKTRVGIGLHAGQVVTGNVGTDVRKQYSITGNTVIVASRVEQLNKRFGSQFIITEEVREKLSKPERAGSRLEQADVKGRTEPLQVLLVA